jgi:hypothetical protein
MSASDHINPELFHGSRAVIKGNAIGTPWSSDSPEAAREYGRTKFPAGEVGPLKVYKVQPFHMPDVTQHPHVGGVTNYFSPAGYMITGEHKFEDEEK